MIYQVKSIDKKENLDWNKISKANIDKALWIKGHHTPLAFAQMVFIKDYGFLVKLTCFESNPHRTCTHDNDDLRVDSSLEAYLMFDDERYMNLETNANGARKQAIRYNRENKKNIYANEFGGFKVKANVFPKYWEVNIDIPLDNLLKLYPNLSRNDFKKGFIFKGNFYKVHELRDTPYEHYLAWQEIVYPFPECHLKEQFGTLVIY